MNQTLTIVVPETRAQIKIAFTKEAATVAPGLGFDFQNKIDVAAMVNTCQMLRNSEIVAPPAVKAAVVAVPGGQEQGAQGTQAPPPGADAPQLVDRQTFDSTVQQMQQQIAALEQALASQGGAPAAPPASPPPVAGAAQPQAAPAPQATPKAAKVTCHLL
jgi:hypothetical protein